MVEQDLVDAARQKLDAMLAPIAGGAGAAAAVRDDPRFEKVTEELEKLNGPALFRSDTVDWRLVAQTCQELLSRKGKDLRVAAYYTVARARTDGPVGLFEGLVVVSELTANFWTTMAPPLERPRARDNICTWLAETVAAGLQIYVDVYTYDLEGARLTAADRAVLAPIRRLCGRFEGDMSEKLEDAYRGGLASLRGAIDALTAVLPTEEPPPPPS